MLKRLVPAAVAVALLAGGCGGSGTASADRTITVGGDRTTPAHLVGAAAGLCQARSVAPTDPVAARADFYNESHDSLHTVARALETVDRGLSAELLVAMQKVEADLESKPPTLTDDLGALVDVYRSSLGRLAITAPPCVE